VWADDYSDAKTAFKNGDYALALKIATPRANQKVAWAQNAMGVLYRTGKGVTQDYAEAVKWFRKAAEQGNAWGQVHVGMSYLEGRWGVLQDTISAHMWFNIAAANGNTKAAGNRDVAAGKLSSSGVEEAQKRAKRCMSSGYKDCD